jgi:Tol biopolymer transport system component
VQGLIEAIQQALDEASAVRSAKEEKARLAAVLEPSPEQIAWADELDNWRAIKASANPQVFRHHVARFPGGVTETYARARLEDLVWAGLGAAPTLDQLADFLAAFPQGAHAKEATERQAVLTEALESEQRRREAQAWATAQKAGTGKALEAFLNRWPQSQYAGEARSRFIRMSDAAALEAFIEKSPTGPHSDAARARIRELKRSRSQNFRERVGDATAEGIRVLIVALMVVGIPTSIWLFGPTLPAEHLIGTLNGHSDEVRSVAFSPDGRMAVSGSKDKVLKLWNVATGRELRTFTGHSGGVMSVAFSPDGLTALSSSGDDTIKLWEVATGSELLTFKGHSSYGSSVAFSPDGRAVLSGGSDGSVRMREVGTGKEIVMVRGAGTVGSVAFSPDGRTALFGSLNKIKLWSLAHRKELRTFEGHSEAVNSVAFSPDGLTALSGSNDKTLKLWEVATGRELRSFSMHSSHVTSAAFAPDGRTALSGSWDGTVRLWDMATGKELRKSEKYALVYSVAFAPDGRTALSGHSDKTLRLWDLRGQ